MLLHMLARAEDGRASLPSSLSPSESPFSSVFLRVLRSTPASFLAGFRGDAFGLLLPLPPGRRRLPFSDVVAD